MSQATWFISYQLKEGKSVEDFLIASKKCNDEVLSKQKGYISWNVLRDGDTWVDLVKWESAEDAKKAETAGAKNPAAKEFYSFINMKSCRLQLYSVEKSY
jgi:heme-degrading monooxygenase HmoA